MHINNISTNNLVFKKTNKNLKKNNQEVSFSGAQSSANLGKNILRVGAGVFSVLSLTSTLSGCKADTTLPVTTQLEETVTQQQSLDVLGSMLDAQHTSGKTPLVDVGFVSMPVTEFYFTNSGQEVIYYPDKDIPTNDAGSVIVTITERESDREIEGNTLNEIIEKVYTDALISLPPDEQIALRNKIIDEVIQANPALSEYINSELGEDADSYEAIANLNLYSGSSSSDETLDIRALSMPTQIVYMSQGQGPTTVDNTHSMNTYVPVINSGSVVRGEDNLMDGEFSSFSDMIYSAYGDDLTDEAYRDIVYAVVNAPQNAEEFEYVLDDMNLLDLFSVGNIHDLNRVIEANTDDLLLDITLPSVTTLRTVTGNAVVDYGSKSAPIYQISPSAPVNGVNDRSVLLKNYEGKMQSGEVYELKHVLQFYHSPNGEGRFGCVDKDGNYVVQTDIDYWDEFDTNIMQQVVYANTNIFAAPYEDESGYHPYGVFDVNEGFDTTGKSLDEIIQNSTINLDRMWNYSFVDENGVLIFDDGVELNLPQFNYRINKGVQNETKPSSPTKPEETPDPTCETDPTFPTEPEDEPSLPEETPEPPCDTDPTFPTEPEEDPTIPEVTPTPTPEPPTEPSTEPDIPTQPSASDIPVDDPDCDDVVHEDIVDEPEPELPSSSSTPPPTSEPSCGDSETYEEIVEEEEPGLP